MRIKINYILAILGAIFAVDAFRIANVLSIFSSDATIVGMLVLIIGIIGLLGIYFYSKSNYKFASLIYLIAGILIILMLTIDSSLFSCIFYILAAIVCFVEGKKDANNISSNNYNPNNQTGHYFNTDGQNIQQYNNTNNNSSSFNMKLLAIALVLILVILIAVIGITMTGNQTTLNVSNIKIESEGYSMYTVSCDMIPNRDYNYLELVVVFYDSDDAEIGKSPLVWNINNPTEGQMIKVSGTALTSNANLKPARAELYFFDKAFSSDTSDAIYAQNVTIN